MGLYWLSTVKLCRLTVHPWWLGHLFRRAAVGQSAALISRHLLSLLTVSSLSPTSIILFMHKGNRNKKQTWRSTLKDWGAQPLDCALKKSPTCRVDENELASHLFFAPPLSRYSQYSGKCLGRRRLPYLVLRFVLRVCFGLAFYVCIFFVKRNPYVHGPKKEAKEKCIEKNRSKKRHAL